MEAECLHSTQRSLFEQLLIDSHSVAYKSQRLRNKRALAARGVILYPKGEQEKLVSPSSFFLHPAQQSGLTVGFNCKYLAAVGFRSRIR